MAKAKKQTTTQTEEKKVEVKRLPDSTVEINFTIPWEDVEKIRHEVVEKLVQEVVLPGFRKGKAPRDLAEKSLSKPKVQVEVLKKVITSTYADAIAKNDVKPIVYPQIHVEAFDEGTTLTYTAKTCEQPTIDLKNYKDAVKSLTAKSKIIVPGKSEDAQKVPLEQILETILGNTSVTVSEVLIDQEATRLLSQLLDELKTLGMNLDQYLASKGITGEALQAEYKKRAQDDIKLEFLLRKIADDEKITVEPADIEAAINGIKDEKQKQEVFKNPYLVANIIRQQKTLDFLAKL